MSKTKTKRARRELKRDGDRKIMAHHRKVAKAAETKAKSTPGTSKPSTANKQKTQQSSDAKAQTAAPKPPVQASQKHAVPFSAYAQTLLVGEGDFSFTRSLALEHGCANVTATSYDSEDEVREKYPTFEEIHKELSELTPPVPLHYSVDAAKLSAYKHLRCVRDEEEDIDDAEETLDDNEDDNGAAATGGPGWDTVCFMFPHTGGLSTDVNRQVRANQALLVSFFKSCLDTPTPAKRLRILQSQNNKVTPKGRPFLRMGGRIIVTLFEGEPYTLWNIRDLARHAGLKVVESWKFDWTQYPGYHHVRTLGAMESGWKGEDRDARMYVFEKIPLVADSDEEKEMQKQARNSRGGPLPSQKKGWAAKLARGENGSDED
ncbi:uncharacterized protein K460DRAFT_328999 [Cucurbitaria berberidis CBS 394.84]|uniref:25S rRNA (uridine-N(3))-methyltransferase BMT5-like domain-containing protein n=1 Tax=Cucurbitaria berberidis CBS 394.84 TaxID=1168544 RepID=A0A9P4GTS6_9PLEO|nr:uncharacterized protein K460DRAFT_328999 [Cucurbitaria berberidis CBS 394.84]KAF1851215.1 hypothetical protein K460DRAFT_328999 [Cucurbitaria berberidis CBS 394.84]